MSKVEYVYETERPSEWKCLHITGSALALVCELAERDDEREPHEAWYPAAHAAHYILPHSRVRGEPFGEARVAVAYGVVDEACEIVRDDEQAASMLLRIARSALSDLIHEWFPEIFPERGEPSGS